MSYPKRLIEVDLPIRRISDHARREKSIRHGHISTLHIWWARRPLASCRAVICAALWPDPADELCPEAFRQVARVWMGKWSKEYLAKVSPQSYTRFISIQKTPAKLDDNLELRGALLDFIADFANWDNSTVKAYLDTSRALTLAAHEALGGQPGTRPLVVDPFAGGGSIPLEALRVGADAFASDLNPIPVLLNKVVLEYIPKYGQRLADEVRKWGTWIKQEAEKELAEFYPKDPDGATPIAYLWARTIQCEGPGCGAEVPLIRSLWLAKKANRSVALQLLPNLQDKRVHFQIIVKKPDGWVDQANPETKIANPTFDGTVKRGSATCPCCGYTTPVARVRVQLKARHGGANDARLMCIISTRENESGRYYHLPTDTDMRAVSLAAIKLEQKTLLNSGQLSLVPNEQISLNEIRRISVPIYGMTHWGDLFSNRQLLALSSLVNLVHRVRVELVGVSTDTRFLDAVQTCLALAVSRQADYTTSLCSWHTTGEKINHTFGRQAIPMFWDFTEVYPLSQKSGDFGGALDWIIRVCNENSHLKLPEGHTEQASATTHPLPENSADTVVTDPPYYDSVPYAYLSDFFYVWLRRMLYQVHTDLFRLEDVPKDAEIVVDRPHELSQSNKGVAFYERELTKAFSEARRILRPEGIGTIVFASKTTASWEAILQAVVDAGWIITGSWPIDTEMEARLAAQGQARLASSVHLVCRPRPSSINFPSGTDGKLIGDWRDILHELPIRIHDWMPRLAQEGVVGADAIFACLGPALEIFSRYSRVEKASGEVVTLKEYLEHVWGAVGKEALNMIFAGADTSGFEEDARLTAMWLWTLVAGKTDSTETEDTQGDMDDEEETKPTKAPSGYVLEYDAARKIAQGLGAHLETLTSLVEVKGDKARLLPVAERAFYLFGKDEDTATTRKKKAQVDLFTGLGLDEVDSIQGPPPKPGMTVLDRLHQSMLLFGAGRSEALKRFLVEEGIGRDPRFWRLAQAFSALFPSSSSEKRWVDGVLARKKGLGL